MYVPQYKKVNLTFLNRNHPVPSITTANTNSYKQNYTSFVCKL